MKKIIIIVFVLLTVQGKSKKILSFAQYDEQPMVDDSNTLSPFTNDGMRFSTVIPNLITSYTRSDYFDMTTFFDEKQMITFEQQWLNVNQSQRRDSSRSFLSWKHQDSSRKGANYILTSEPRCVRQMCSVKLKYNGTLSTRTSGCLSFSLRTRGQPVGQLWIVEDIEQENNLQKIELINKTLRIERTLRSKIKNLSIETKLLFRNPKLDALFLSNLNVNWKGPCPKNRSVVTPSPRVINRRATLQDDFMTMTSEGSGLLTTNDDFQSSQQDFLYDSTTIVISGETKTKRPFSFLNQKNIGWSLSLITLFCIFVVLAAVGHSLWLIRRHYHYTWHVVYDSQIQFLARRSLRSSTRSETKIATISQIAYDILQSDTPKEFSPANSERSTPMSYYTYL